jgi:hypothetical protein
VDTLQTVEQALEVNPDELMFRPEALRVRGELQAKQGTRKQPRPISAKPSRSREK